MLRFERFRHVGRIGMHREENKLYAREGTFEFGEPPRSH